jgi:hypothetical protein
MNISRGHQSEDVLQGNRHAIFIEGGGDEAIDPTILKLLLPPMVRAFAIGPGYGVEAAASALYAHHPHYYFLIDRDHRSEEHVELTWQNFLQPGNMNLLIWRKREIESYFLDPDYLRRSSYCRKSVLQMRNLIAKEASGRVYLETANIVLVGCRESLKVNWVKKATAIAGYENENQARASLIDVIVSSNKDNEVSKALSPSSLNDRFTETLDELSGGVLPLQFGSGTWPDRISAKKILNIVINSCFSAKDEENKVIRGKDLLLTVIKDLIQQPNIPTDFALLRDFMNDIVK